METGSKTKTTKRLHHITNHITDTCSLVNSGGCKTQHFHKELLWKTQNYITDRQILDLSIQVYFFKKSYNDSCIPGQKAPLRS